MKNKKGFTLVEIIGVVIVLGIVLGLASVAYISISNHIKTTYYRGIETVLLEAGGEYYTHNSEEAPQIFGNNVQVSIETLVNGKYVEEVKDRDGNSCEGYVGAYKNSYERTNYYVCLVCSEYETDNAACYGDVDYSLQMTATVRNTMTRYQEGSYVKDYVTLTFRTFNDVKEIKVENATGNVVKSCNVEVKNGLASCKIQVDETGEYTAYGVSENGSKTDEKEITIKIDNQKPSFDIYENGVMITGKQEKDATNGNINLIIDIRNIKDLESGIKSIRYSFEKEGKSSYQTVTPTKEEFRIEKTLETGKYTLIVEIEDNAGNKETKRIEYEVYKRLSIPTSDLYCNNLTYNGYEQVLTKSPGTGFTFINNRGTNVGSYTVTARLNEDYRWSDGTNTDKTLTCTIKRLQTATIGSCRSLTYNGTSQLLASGGDNVTYRNAYGTNAGSYTVTINTTNNYAFSDGSITKNLTCSISKKNLTVIPNNNQSKTYGSSDPTLTYTYSGQISGETPRFTGSLSRASGENVGTYLINRGTLALTNNGAFLANNYNLVLSGNVNFRINQKGVSNLTISLQTNNYTYDGTAKTPSVTVRDGTTTLTNGTHYTVSYNNNINAGTATVTITGRGNYSGTTTKTFTIGKRNVTIKANNQSLDGTTTIDKSLTQITTSNLVGGHSVTSITLTQSTTSPTTSGTITPSNAVIKSGTTDVTKNYNITYQTGTLVIKETKICATFMLNGASQIDGVAANKTNVCCSATSNGTCTITSPRITPKTNFEVVGWSDNASKLQEITHDAVDENGNPAKITLNANKTFYAVTVSKASTLKTYSIEFNLNGADSYTLQGTTYNQSNTFTCRTDYVYNGAVIPNTCTFTLPTITRSGGTVYGWDPDDTNEGNPKYSVGQTITISSDLVLNAITSREIVLSYDGNGGTTTLPDQVGIVYNNKEGYWFNIPAYDNANMCRNRDSEYVGYKNIGLVTDLSNDTAEFCLGGKIYLENNQTLYGLWKKVYATGKIKTNGSNLNIRASRSTSSTIVGKIPNGGTAYITGARIGTWYPVIYGNVSGWSSSDYIPSVTKVETSSCNYTDYTCGGKDYVFSVTPTNIELNLYENELSYQLTIENQCGDIVSATSNNSKVSVTKSGLVSTTSSAVSYGETLTATLTFKTEGGCTSTVTVKVKNINETPPTISISISGSTYSSGYKSGAKVTATCESVEGISSFTAYDNTGDYGTLTVNETNKKTRVITLSSASSSRKVTVSCTSNNGMSASDSRTYRIYVYSKSSACGVDYYNYRGSYTCCNSSGSACDKYTCNASRYPYTAYSYCRNMGYSGATSGSCTRSAVYDSCWHT